MEDIQKISTVISRTVPQTSQVVRNIKYQSKKNNQEQENIFFNMMDEELASPNVSNVFDKLINNDKHVYGCCTNAPENVQPFFECGKCLKYFCEECVTSIGSFDLIKSLCADCVYKESTSF